MGLLSEDYYKKAISQPTAPSPTPTAPQPGLGERVENAILAPLEQDTQREIEMAQRGVKPGVLPGQEVSIGTLSEEEQIKKYGGVVGSTEYFKYQADNPYESFLGRKIGETVGIKYPDQQTWDKMTFSEKTRWTIAGAAKAAATMVVKLPRETVKAPIRAGYSFIKMQQDAWQDVKKFAGVKVEPRTERQELNVPLLGAIPTFSQSYADARNSGMGKWGAALSTFNTALGDLTIGVTLAESVKTGLSRPRVKSGQVIEDVAPVKKILEETPEGVKQVKAPVDSVNEYYSLPSTVAKKFGGSSNNTFLKLSPADIGDGVITLEMSVVQTRGGRIQRIRDKVSPKGNLYEGDFGPEIKIETSRVPINSTSFLDDVKPKLYRGSDGNVTEHLNTFERVKEFANDQHDVIQELADAGNPQALEILENPTDFYLKADRLIKDVYGKDFDAIRYGNAQMSGKGIEYFDTRTGKFYSEQKATAEAYSLQSRGAKYKSDTPFFKNTTDPILQEAKRYKSAEEFVKAQESLFHGTTKEVPIDVKDVISFDRNIGRAQNYADAGNVFQTYEIGGKRVFPETKVVIDEAGEKIRVAKNPVVEERFIPDRTKVLDLGKYRNGEIIDRTGLDIFIQALEKVKASGADKTNPLLRRSIPGMLENIKRYGFDWGFTKNNREMVKELVYPELKKMGYGAIEYSDDAGRTIAVFDKNILKTKSQLTDIWSKAHDQKALAAPFQGAEFAAIEAADDLLPEASTVSILPKPLKGFENKPITFDQLTNLRQIMNVNDITPSTASALMRTITGKNSLGDLTQAEYVNLSQTMATFSKAARYTGGENIVNIFGQYLSPQRHWMRTYEEKSGVPLYSDVYVPMEDAIRLRDVFRDGYRQKARDIFGEYAGPKFAEERRLVKAYMEGDKAAVLENQNLSPQVKSDLAVIADKLRPLYDELGAEFNIPTEVFLKDYQPHIKNIGGVFMIYKDPAENILNSLSFFAEYKRTGSLTAQVDDALALFDIYTNAGSNKKFLNPALERISDIGNQLPPTLKNSVKSYVGEKLGHAGRLEQYVNEMGPVLARKLGANLPPDIGRQMTQFIMDTSYAGALGIRPGAVIRNMLQNPLMTFPRLGTKFYVEAVKKALTKEGRAELARKGFTVDLGTPYGYELVKESANVGGRIGQAQQFYRKATQATLKPYSGADQFTRAATYWQTKYQWDDAVARFNSGKIDWQQFEKEIDFQALSPVDRNIVRKRIVDGNQEGAFDHYVRDVLDETQFPYRKGASSRITYGLAGKIGTQFGQWSIEFVHTLSRWAKTGQWDKIIRFHAAATLTERTIRDVFGFNADNWTGVDAVSPTPAPAVQFAQEFGGLISAWKDGSAEAFEEHKEELIDQLRVLGRPAGLQITLWQDFWKSVKAGPNEDGMYPVYSKAGKLKYFAPFKDIWWKMWGFPSDAMSKDDKVMKDMRNAKFNYSQAKQKALELWQQEKYDQASDLISEYNIQLTPQDFNAYYIPQTQRSYQALPASLKANFAPQVFK